MGEVTITIGKFRYRFNGSLTVNVDREIDSGEIVNFDAFTFGNEPHSDYDAALEIVRRHYIMTRVPSLPGDPEPYDHRYVIPHPTRAELMG